MAEKVQSTWLERTTAIRVPVLVFGLAHTQAPLYYSNQHQYMLHGLAQAGHGHLQEDWLARTVDPTPIFSQIVAATHRLHDGLFHVYFLAALGIYVHALLGIFRYLTGQSWSSPAGLFFLTLLTATHAGLFRLASAHGLGADYPWFLQTGVANQYILGPGLQPSVSGVLILAAISLFLANRPWLAISASSAAAVVHATYLPTAALVTLAFMIVTWRRGSVRKALLLGVTALIIVLPVVIYDLVHFGPTDSATFAEAQRIIAHERIPHHAQAWRWFDRIAAVQIGWMVLAILLVRRSELLPLMAIPFTLAAALSLIQIATNNDMLALLFPWRTSAILMPLATAIIFTRISQGLMPRLTQLPGIRLAFTAVLFILASSGLIISVGRFAYRMNAEELPLLEYIRTHRQSGETYLLPVEIPKPRPGQRGVFSTSFTPAPKRGKQHGLISVDLQRFRLYTGAPIFIDFKSIPYRDVDVLEWWRRLQVTQWLYDQPDWDREDVRSELRSHGITHVVTPANRTLPMTGAIELYADDSYRLYRLPQLDPPNP